jgi:hypothetical protein
MTAENRSPLVGWFMVCGVIAGLTSCLSHPVLSDPSSRVLIELSRDFSHARAEPPDSRPTPPEVDLKPLIGLTRAAIRARLGPFDHYPSPWHPTCQARRCEFYIYGPPPARLSDDIQHEGDTDSILVPTGGPILLLLGFSGDRVLTAQWRGQR